MPLRDISEIIREKAEQKLIKDMNDCIRTISKSPFETIPDGVIIKAFYTTPGDAETIAGAGYRLGALLNSHINNGIWYQTLKAKLPEYIERETREFMDKVEQLSIQVAELTSTVENLPQD